MARKYYEGYTLEVISIDDVTSDTVTGANAADIADILSFKDKTGPIKAYLDPARINEQIGLAEGLHYSGIEGFEGTEFGDELGGDSNNNFLFGFGGEDTLNGGSGYNVLSGGEGDDLIIADLGTNEIRGDGGNDTVSYANATTGIVLSMSRAVDNAGAAAGDRVYTVENVIGTSFADYIIGSSTNNSLEGGNGNDRLDGYSGADTFNGGEGIDTVCYDYSNQGVTVSLKDNTTDPGAPGATGGDAEGDKFDSIENVLGSSHADTITGNGVANVINGSYGADRMSGEGGNDVYYVDNPGDRTIETTAGTAGGTDLVYSYITHTLAANIENLYGLGSSAIRLYGNALNNTITGNSGANVINGGSGNDTINGGSGKDTFYGGSGKDTFQFTTRASSSNLDKIADYSTTYDSIQLDNKIFTKIGTGSPTSPKKLASSAFWKGSKAHDKSDRVIYDSSKGYLYYDADGTGSSKQVLIATMSKNLKMTYAEFYVI